MSKAEIELSLDNIQKSAKEFLNNNVDHKKFAFVGQMGAGKTTFITALCRELKVLDLVSSPTFSIINEYTTEDGENVYHFDFYRIENIEELYDIGFEEYCDSNDWCFIEWPEKGEEIIPEDFIFVDILLVNDQKRIIKY
jgi:tRNA threonylcarbamoyladenosine biosynthesis protein TsaE